MTGRSPRERISRKGPRALILPVILLGALPCASGQRGFTPTGDLERAKTLKADWPDASVVRMTSTVSYSFAKGKGGQALVTANERIQESLASVQHGVTYTDGTGYDDQSSVPEFSVRDEKRKQMYVQPYRGSYEQDGIFHSDAMIFAYELQFSTEGRLLNVDYTKVYNDVKYLCTSFFREDTPILERVLEFDVPDWLELELLEMNFGERPIARRSAMHRRTGRSSAMCGRTSRPTSAIRCPPCAPRASPTW